VRAYRPGVGQTLAEEMKFRKKLVNKVSSSPIWPMHVGRHVAPVACHSPGWCCPEVFLWIAVVRLAIILPALRITIHNGLDGAIAPVMETACATLTSTEIAIEMHQSASEMPADE
jgi:hypothetical protein